MHARPAARAAWLVGLLAASELACGGSPRPPLAKAGAERDEGAGDLARASQRLTTQPDTSRDRLSGYVPSDRRRIPARWDTAYPYGFGGGIYGGDPYGGMAYGGVGYANWVIPQWSYTPVNRVPRYKIVGGLTGAIEGSVTWVGAPPTKVTSACGPLDNPTLRVGTDKAARGVLVYIEKITTGRHVPYYTRPVTVGGTVAKRGCTLVPAAQIVTPLPGSLTIHGDETRTQLEITIEHVADKMAPPAARPIDADAIDDDEAPPKPVDKTPKVQTLTQNLQEAGFVQIAAKRGVTRIESTDRKLAPAWVVAVDTPYYAITDDQGRYRIDELAPGTYEVTFWQAPVTTTNASGAWTYGQPIVVRRTIKVGAKAAQLSVALNGR